MVFQDAATPRAAIVFVVDGGGTVLSTGVKGYLVAPFDCTIVGVELEADAAGYIQVDIYKDTYANFPPTALDDIVGATPPILNGADKYQDMAVSDWITAVSYGDILGFHVMSATNMTKLTITLYVEKS